VKLQGEFSA